MEKIQCGISGYIRTHRYLERTRWRPFERYFLAEKETHIEKKIHTMLCLKMRQLWIIS